MVQIIDDPDAGNIFGRIGAGIGKGLSEQIPKEIDRYRLSQGLRDLELKAKQGQLSPFQQAAELAAIPGMTPQMAAVYQPLLDQAQQHHALLKKYQPGKRGTELPPQTSAQDTDRRIPVAGWEPLSQMPEAIEERGTQTFLEQPGRFRTVQDAIEYESKRAAAQKTMIEEIDQHLDKNISEAIQKAGPNVYGDVSGEMLQKIRARAYERGDKEKISPKKLAQDAAKEALEYAKSNQNLKTMGSFLSKLRHPFSGNENKKSLKEIRDVFKKQDDLEGFRDKLISYQGLSDKYADYLAFPVSQNKEINNFLSTLKKPIFSPYEDVKKEKGVKRGIGKSKSEEEIADFVADHLTKDDSILSIALALEGRGYNANKFIDAMRKYKNEMTLRQARAFEIPSNISPTLGDKYLFAITGLDKILEVQ